MIGVLCEISLGFFPFDSLPHTILLESEEASIAFKDLGLKEQEIRKGRARGLGRPLISVLGFGFTLWGFGCVPFSLCSSFEEGRL